MAEENTTNNIPAWVDPDYGYDPANPRKPNMREMMEAMTGKTVEEIYASSGEDYANLSSIAAELIYSVGRDPITGADYDTRDFVAIGNAATDPITGEMDGEKFKAAVQIANSQMFGGTSVEYVSSSYETDAAGNTIIDANGNPVNSPPALHIVGGNGTIIRELSGNTLQMSNTLANFGIKDASWVDTVSQSMGDNLTTNLQNTFNELKETYNPFVIKTHLGYRRD